MILLVVNVESLETRCNQLKYQEQKSRSPNITAKLLTGFQLFLSLMIIVFIRRTPLQDGQRSLLKPLTDT